MSPISRISNVSARLGLPWYKALLVEAFVRLYRQTVFRVILRPFFRATKPCGAFFVVGCYNSGTTVVKNAIALHPKITIAPVEGDRLTDALSTFERNEWPRCLYGNSYIVMQERKHGAVSAEDFYSDLRPWIDEHKYFLEKSISNTVRIPLLRNAFPGTRFICVVREEDGVIRGIQRRSAPQGYAREILGTDKYPEAILHRQWQFFYSLVLNDLEPGLNDIYFCSYEKFLSEPDAELGRIYAFLGLTIDRITFENSLLHVDKRSLRIHNENSSLSNRQYYLDSAEHLQVHLKNSHETA